MIPGAMRRLEVVLGKFLTNISQCDSGIPPVSEDR
jgi:hypothetical protein